MLSTVSVIIPTWNRAHTLGAAIQSALSQEPAPLEILVCDDGSSDPSRELVESMADPRIRWIEGPHMGRPAIARNRGIAESRGQWIAFLDSDDEWLPGKLQTQLALAHRLDCLATCGNAVRVVPGQGIQGQLLALDASRLGFKELLRGNFVICSSAMFERSLLRKVGGFPERAELAALEDYALWLRVATFTDFAFVAQPVVSYRDDQANSIRGREASDARAQRERVYLSYLEWAPPFARHALALRWASARASARHWKERVQKR